MSESDKKKNKARKDWEANHEAIKNCYVKYIDRYHKMPTITYVAETLKVDWNTVDRHLKGLKFTPAEHPLRVLTDDVILDIRETAKKNPQSQKLWVQLMENWIEKSRFDVTTKGRALQGSTDLSDLTDEELKEYIRINKKLDQSANMGGGEGAGEEELS